MIARVIAFSGRLWRILFADRADEVLLPVRHPVGRFHREGQRALYASPDIAAARVAIDSYYRPDDPPRVVVALRLDDARLLDFRRDETAARLGLAGDETRADWRADMAAGREPASWRASDLSRRTGADGMIYVSRKAPPHWHVALFDWNRPGAPTLAHDGVALPFASGAPPQAG